MKHYCFSEEDPSEFVDRECADDIKLRKEVLKLLESEKAADSFTREIGRGGMRVYFTFPVQVLDQFVSDAGLFAATVPLRCAATANAETSIETNSVSKVSLYIEFSTVLNARSAPVPYHFGRAKL